MIRTEGLTKHYGKTVAVSDLNLHVREGEIYGFLGPNGAGKTTTILMLLGLVRPTAGRVELFGREMREGYFDIKRRIGVLSEFHYLYEEMTAAEYLRFFGRLYGVRDVDRRIRQVLERVNLAARAGEFLGGYSKGMKQKLSLARVLLHDPEVLILDEPVSSLDPYGIREVREIIMEENRRGKTLFISSHILSEIERTCHRVGILHKGRLMAEDTMDALRRRLAHEVELVVELERIDEEILRTVESLDFVNSVARENGQLRIKTRPDKDFRADLSRAITQSGGVVLEMQTHQMSLEEAFVTITEKNISLLAKEEMAS